METRAFKDLRISTMTLGTVQLGLPYGIANTSGQPDYATARDIIARAYEGGVTVFDTAVRYGESESVVGRALAELGISDRVVVVSKVPMMGEFSSAQAVDDFLLEEVTGMLARLKLEQLPICMFHFEENYIYLEALSRLRDRGLIKHIGVSQQSPACTKAVLDDGWAEAQQIPTNMLDQRFIRQGLLRRAGALDMAVFIRSVYLQGLLLMPEADFISELHPIIPVRQKLEALAREAGLTMAEMSLRFVVGLEGVSSVVVGVETVEQMRENLRLFAGPLPADLQQAIFDCVPDLSEQLIVPRNWSKRMPDAVPTTR